MTDTVIVKKLSELLVKDLRAELEKRGLDHKGVKAVLLERLQEALVENGEDPENLMFETCISPKVKTAREETQVKETEGDEEDAYDELDEEEGQEEILEEEDDDIVMELIEDSDDANPEEEDIYGDLGGDMQEDLDEMNEEDVFNLNLENEQMVTNEEEEEDQEEDVEEVIEEDDGTEGAEAITEEDVADPTSATNDEDESMVEPVNNTQVSDKQGKVGNQSPEASGVESTAREDKKKSHGERADRSKAENSDKNLKNSTKESKVNEAKTDPTGKSNRESSSEKKPTSTSGSETPPTKSSTSASTSPSKDDKDSKGSKKSASAKSNLWVSGLSKETRAADLKSAFSKYGKVIGAKIIWNAKLPGHHCFGFLSMSSNPEAANAIKQLNHSVLHGRTIDVTWARNQTPTPLNQKSSSTSSSLSATPATAKKETKEAPAMDSNKPAPKPVAKETKDISEKKDEKATPAKVEKTVMKKDDTPGKKKRVKAIKVPRLTPAVKEKMSSNL